MDCGEEIGRLVEAYPNARATKRHLGKLGLGRDHSRFVVDSETGVIPDEILLLVKKQLTAYFRFYEALSLAYFRRGATEKFLDETYMRFINPGLLALVKEYPTQGLLGVRYGSDVVRSGDVVKTVEVNMGGATGGISQLHEALKLFRDNVHHLSPEAMGIHALHALNEYYLEVCRSFDCEPKEFAERQIVIVEDDGYHPGSILLSKHLQDIGARVCVAPREALKYDRELKVLFLVRREGDRSIQTQVDQVIPYFNLEADPEGEIVRALKDEAVVLAMEPLVELLGAKFPGAVLQEILRHPDSQMAKEVGLEPDDIAVLQEMMPETFVFAPEYLQRHQVNGFDLFGTLPRCIAKETVGGKYGGKGVYDLGDQKQRRPFVERVKIVTLRTIRRVLLQDRQNLLCRLFDEDGWESVFGYLESQGLEVGRERFEKVMVDNGRRKLKLSKQKPILGLRRHLEDVAEGILSCCSSGGGVCDSHKLADALLEYLSTRLTLPFIFQEKISGSKEYRVAGTVGLTPEDAVVTIQGASFGVGRVKRLQPVSSESDYERTGNPSAEVITALEPETEAPTECTDLELSVLPADKRYKKALVLMCGVGRHARAVSSRSGSVIGVDSVAEIVGQARVTSANIGNITYECCDALDYLGRNDGEFDLATISGNSIIFLDSDRQDRLYDALSNRLLAGGQLLLDFVDIEAYEKILNDHGPTLVYTKKMPSGDIAQRLVYRKVMNKVDGVFELESTKIYLLNGSEVLHRVNRFCVPEPESLAGRLMELGFKVEVSRILDQHYRGTMMHHRHLVLAVKNGG